MQFSRPAMSLTCSMTLRPSSCLIPSFPASALSAPLLTLPCQLGCSLLPAHTVPRGSSHTHWSSPHTCTWHGPSASQGEGKQRYLPIITHRQGTLVLFILSYCFERLLLSASCPPFSTLDCSSTEAGANLFSFPDPKPIRCPVQ